MYHWVPRNSDSNYMPIEGHKNGSLTFSSQIWLWNTFPISRDQSSQNQILGKKYVRDWALFALKMCWKVTLVIVSTKTYERQGILGCRVNVLVSRHFELEFGKKNWIVTTKIKRAIVVWIWTAELLEIRIPIMCW